MMRHRDRIGLNFPPLLLRLMLGVIFLQAGLGKVLQNTEFTPDRAARLANMGVISSEASAEPSISSAPGSAVASTPAAPRQAEARQYTSADFPTEIRARRVYSLALRIQDAAHPAPLEGGASVRGIWPRDLAAGKWPVYFAWSVALVEIAGGALLLIGLLTRIAALAISGVMLGALWLDQIGPAVQKGETVLGFLPAYPAFDPGSWQKLWLQFALFMAALALAFLGPGRASIDAMISGRRDDDDEE